MYRKDITIILSREELDLLLSLLGVYPLIEARKPPVATTLTKRLTHARSLLGHHR